MPNMASDASPTSRNRAEFQPGHGACQKKLVRNSALRTAVDVLAQARSYFGTEMMSRDNAGLGYIRFEGYGVTRYITVPNILSAANLAVSGSEIDGACAVLAHSSPMEPKGDLLSDLISTQHCLTRNLGKTPDMERERITVLETVTGMIELVRNNLPEYVLPVLEPAKPKRGRSTGGARNGKAGEKKPKAPATLTA